ERMAAALEAYIQQRVATEVAHQVKEIIEQQTVLRHRMFGRSSEAHAGQGQLFNEAEAEAPADAGEETDSGDAPQAGAPPKQQPARRRGKRRPLPPELPRVEHVVELAEDKRQCDCGTPMVQIGEEVSEQL